MSNYDPRSSCGEKGLNGDADALSVESSGQLGAGR